jgi:AcrR family transcriptional regulator
MAIPALTEIPWSELTAEAKRERTLAVADELFAREGIDAPMPALAEAIGVGVGSIYRQFECKQDVLAALVVARIDAAREGFEAALDARDAFEGLRRATLECVETAARDHLAQAAWNLHDHPEVQPVRLAARAAIRAALDRARDAGQLRDDVTVGDFTLIMHAVKRAEETEPGGAIRLAELVLRGMRASCRES